MARVSMSHRVIWQPLSVTEVADEGAKVDSMLDNESSDVTDDIVELLK
jgi:hypothetical protein